MAQDKSNLPEGTDKVIGGASGTAAGTETIGSDVLVDTAPATTLGDDNGGDASLSERLRSGGEKLTGQAADKARDLVGQGLERSAEALSSASRMVGDTAEGIDERLGPEYGDYARRAATAIENAANTLARKDPDELIEDTRKFVRRSPGVAIAGAAIVGFALARLIKTGLAGGSDEGDDDDDNSGKRRGSQG